MGRDCPFLTIVLALIKSNDCSSIDQINRKEECQFNEKWLHTVINYGLLVY